MRKLHLFSILVALIFATTTLWAVPSVAVDGKLPGAFTINSDGGRVYFSQGNLQYRATADGSGTDLTHDVAGGGTAQGIWRFATNQYDFVGGTGCSNIIDGNVSESEVLCSNNNISNTYTGWIDLFGQGTSGYNEKYPYMTSTNDGDYIANLTGENANYEWGYYNAISNGGNQPGLWRVLTSSEWKYLFNTRTTTSGVRYAKAIVNGVYGAIILPDDWNTSYYTLANTNSSSSHFDANVISETNWTNLLEAHGAVFLPETGERYSGTNWVLDNCQTQVVANCRYRTSSSNVFTFTQNNLDLQTYLPLNGGNAVRLVSDTPPLASIGTEPSAIDGGLTYTGLEQALVNPGSDVVGGTLKYSLDGTNWSEDIPTGTNVGNYNVYWKVEGDANHSDFIPNPAYIAVSIAKANVTLTAPTAITPAPSYTGSAQPLVNPGSATGGTIYYSTDGSNWMTDVPTASAIGDYNVWYKVIGDANHIDIDPVGPIAASIIIPTVTDQSNASTIETVLALNPENLQVERTIYADDEYNTICLPFSLDESALAASPLAGFNRLKTFKGAQVTGTAPDLYIDIFVEDATTIEAGVPYLITYPAAHADIVDPVFNSITVTTTTPSATSADGVTFQGMFAQVHIDPYTSSARDEDYLFVGANSQLYWPLSTQTSSDIKMRGFRAYFIIDRNSISSALAPKGTRARIMDAPKTTTAIDNTSAKFGGSEKIIENGILYIIRNGVKYNAQGQIVK